MSPGKSLALRRALFFGAFLVAWGTLAALHLWPGYLFPSPYHVGRALLDGFLDKSVPIGIVGSLWRLVRGYALAMAVGLPLGILLAKMRPVKETLGLLIMGFQALPSICWLPLALLWFGLNERAILFVVVMGAVFSIAQSTEDGVRNTAPVYLRAARNLGARGFRLYSSVILPSALPSIVSGMKLGWSFAWRSLMAGELLYSLPGLGKLLNMGRELNDMSQVLATILVIMTLGLISDRFIFGRLERRVRERWGLG